MSIQHRPEDFFVTVRDRSFPNSKVVELLLKLSVQKLTARDLIAERVRAECDDQLQSRAGQLAEKLILPCKKERALNGERISKFIDAGRQVKRAWSAFEKNGFILLLNDRQVETLDEELEVTSDTVVTFLKLTPLVGG
jgi:hypothetical protein